MELGCSCSMESRNGEVLFRSPGLLGLERVLYVRFRCFVLWAVLSRFGLESGERDALGF